MSLSLSPDETIRRGKSMYDDRIKNIVEPAFIGQFVAIDVISGDFRFSPSAIEAADAIHSNHPEAEIALLLIGYDSTAAMGARLHRTDDVTVS